MKKQILISASIVAMFSTTPVSATEFIAFQLGVYDNSNNGCDICHANANINTADKGNLMSAAKTAYNQDRFGLSGLKTFLEASAAPATPVVPSCTGGQVLNATKNVCETPKPAIPTCTGKTVLNAAKDACVAQPAPIVTPPPVVTPPPATTTTTANTNPVLNKVATQWDAKVGEVLKIPLSVQDAEQDEFKMLASKTGVKFSKVYTDEKTQLPTVDFLLTPTAKDVNTVLTFTFQAKETKTLQKLMSNKISLRVRVWAAGDRNAASITKLNVSTSVFKSGKLNLSGTVVFNNLLTTVERKSFIANKFDLTVMDNSNVILASKPITIDAKGNWSIAMPLKSVPCDIVLQYEGQNAARTVVGVCTKISAAASVISVASREHDDDDDHKFGEYENEHDDHDD